MDKTAASNYQRVLRRRVLRGITWLDENYDPAGMAWGSWLDHLNLDELDIKDVGRCVLGQLYGDYWHAVHTVFDGDIPQVLALGFTLNDAQLDSGRYGLRPSQAWDLLQATWVRELRKLENAVD